MNSVVRQFRKATALVLCIALLLSLLSGCKTKPTVQAHESAVPTPITTTESTMSDQSPTSTANPSGGNDPAVTNPPINTPPAQETPEQGTGYVTVSSNWEDYVGDLDAFVYGLLSTEFSRCFDVFTARIELPDGTDTYGFAYTDFAACMEDDEGHSYFPAGFIAFIGETGLPADIAEQGIEIENLDYAGNDIRFVYAYDTDAFWEHCVIWGQYLQYGVDDKGSVTYRTSDYQWGSCDETLGALYSYDEDKFVFDPDVGNYIPITGESLAGSIDYSSLEAEINRTLREQDLQLSNSEVQTTVYNARDAVEAYLLSIQEETFLGYPVTELVKQIQEYDPDQFIRYSPDGALLVEIGGNPVGTASDTAKWLVGICSSVALLGSVAAGVFVPALTPVSGAVSGAAVEAFLQVVGQNTAVEDMNWAKVAVSSVSGALLAWLCPLLASSAATGAVNTLGLNASTEVLAKLAGYGVQTISTALVSGATGAAFAAIDGKTSEETWDAFFAGAAIGAAGSVLAAGLSEVGNLAMKTLANSHQNSWLVKALEKGSAFIGEHQVHLKNDTLESILAPKSVYEAVQCAMADLELSSVIPVQQTPVLLEDGYYDSPNDVAEYVSQYHKLPPNYMTKKQAADRFNWKGGELPDDWRFGGDYFGNYEGRLPEGHYIECDVGVKGASKRTAERLVICTDDWKIYYTNDHYETFTLIKDAANAITQLPYLPREGYYDSRDEVAAYVYQYHKLPPNYMTKSEAMAVYSRTSTLPDDKCIGGDVFYNREGVLPKSNYIECDLNTMNKASRGTERLVIDTDNWKIYSTDDHYGSFTLLNEDDVLKNAIVSFRNGIRYVDHLIHSNALDIWGSLSLEPAA